MSDMAWVGAARLAERVLRVFRLPGLRSPRIYSIWGLPALQPTIERLGRARAWLAFDRARRDCPAYTDFLGAEADGPIDGPADFARVPITTKENYVRRYSIEARCHGGRIPDHGVVIDESSGSSGTPNNWVRGTDERASTRRLLHHSYRLRFGDRPLVFLNCFALGPWATGMNVSMALADVSILKSIGPDKAKLENTLDLFGRDYGYIVAGYPPFVKDWLDTTGLDLDGYEIHLITGGEGCSEGLRDHFEKTFRSAVSSYGASDLEINLAAETDLSIELRRLAGSDPGLSREMFGRERPPMVFQYNPFDYFVETSDEGELVFTIGRRATVAPKIRYNLRDLGGTKPYREVAAILARRGVELAALATPAPALPFLWVFGRNDLSVPFYGAKVFTTDLETILHETPELAGRYSSFQLETVEDDDLDRRLIVRLERAPEKDGEDPVALGPLVYERLREVNQDFREVSKLFGPDAVVVEAYANGEGPFELRDRRVKERYVVSRG